MTLPTFSIPPVGPTAGKIWGKTQLVFATDTVEVHTLSILKGGYSSRHSHQKWNRFQVISGRLIVRMFHDNGEDMVDETTLTAGQITDVPPGVRHEFEALENCAVIEIYWVSLDASDINRHGTQGGLKDV